NAEDFTAADPERDRLLRVAPGAQALDPEALIPAGDPGRVRLGGNVAADHQPHHVVVGQLVAPQRADIGAVAKHDRAVGDRPDFAETMRDVDHSYTIRAESCDDL